MILYIVFSLGRITGCATMPVEVKITIAIFGTLLVSSVNMGGKCTKYILKKLLFQVLVSIASSVGIYGYVGVETTLVVFQILPFLVR